MKLQIYQLRNLKISSLFKSLIIIATGILISQVKNILNLGLEPAIANLAAAGGLIFALFQLYLDASEQEKNDADKLELKIEKIADETQETITFILDKLQKLSIDIGVLSRLESANSSRIIEIREDIADTKALGLQSSKMGEAILQIQSLNHRMSQIESLYCIKGGDYLCEDK